MLRFTLLLGALALLALLLPGCPKKPASSVTTPPKTTVDEMLAAQQPAAPSFDEIREARTKAGELPEEEVKLIRGELVRQAPTFGATTTEDLINGLDIAPQGVIIANAVVQIHQTGSKQGSMADKAYVADVVRQYFEALKGKSDDVRAQPPVVLTAEQQREQREQLEAAGEHLRPAEDPTGDWRSVREVREGEDKLLVEHSDAYYKILSLPFQNPLATFQEYKDGEMLSIMEYPFTYDDQLGELSVTNPSGEPGMTYEIREKLAEPGVLYVRPKGEFIYTVYTMIGRGGKPATEEDRKRDAEIMQRNNEGKDRSATGEK